MEASQRKKYSDEIFLPINAYTYFLKEIGFSGDELSKQSVACTLSAVSAWNFTRQVYNISTELFFELVKTPYKEVVPFEVFNKFPNYGIYIRLLSPVQLQGSYDSVLMGFWCSMGYALRGGDFKNILVVRHIFHASGKTEADPVNIALVKGKTIAESFKETFKYHCGHVGEDEEKAVVDLNCRLLNVILYICSSNCEIMDASPNVTRHPFKLMYGKKKKGVFQLLPPLRPKVLELGKSVSASLQEFGRLSKSSTSPIRPHVRRAHWHGFWTGPRSGERDYILKWIPPILVGTNNGYIDRAVI
jgi:hypothetical protein